MKMWFLPVTEGVMGAYIEVNDGRGYDGSPSLELIHASDKFTKELKTL